MDLSARFGESQTGLITENLWAKYKVWMRTVLVLWWVVLLLGLATYGGWYVPNLFPKMKLRRPQKGQLSASTEFVLLIAHRVVAAFEPVFTLSRRK